MGRQQRNNRTIGVWHLLWAPVGGPLPVLVVRPRSFEHAGRERQVECCWSYITTPTHPVLLAELLESGLSPPAPRPNPSDTGGIQTQPLLDLRPQADL
jgi:hypothetical protein